MCTIQTKMDALVQEIKITEQLLEQNISEFSNISRNFRELTLRVEKLTSFKNTLCHCTHQPTMKSSSSALLGNTGYTKEEQGFIQKVIDVFERHYSNCELELSTIAHEVSMSERQLQRKLKAIMNRSPSEYLKAFRLNKSKKLLVQEVRVGDISDHVGFTSHAYFSKCFKAHFGMTAKQYQLQSSE